MREARKVALICLLGAACWLGGCGQRPSVHARGVEPPINAWVASEMLQLTDRTPPAVDLELFDSTEGQVSLFAAGNETAAFQVVVDAGFAMSDVRVELSELAGPAGEKISAADIRLFRLWPREVGAYPAWYVRLAEEAPQRTTFFDAMVPLDGATEPLCLQAGQRLAVWVDVCVPRSALPGNYTGSIRVRAAGWQDWSATVCLKVHDFVLPDTRPFVALGSFDHEALFAALVRRDGQKSRPFRPANLDRTNPDVRRGLAVMRQLMRLARDHGLDLCDRQLAPLIKRDAAGNIRLDWSDYDAIAQPYLSGTAFDDGIGCRAWPSPFSTNWPRPEDYGGIDSPEYAAVAQAVIQQSREHLAGELGAAGRLLIWPCLEAAGREEFLRLARIVRQADPNTAILARLGLLPENGKSPAVADELPTLADILAPPGELLDGALQQRLGRSKPLAGVWLAPGRPPYMPNLGALATPAEARAVAWFAVKYGCPGILLDDVLNWPADPADPPIDDRTRLFYPGTFAGLEQVVASVRLKHLRRGLQDACYLQLLNQRLQGQAAKAAVDCMVRYAGLDACGRDRSSPYLDGFVRDGAAWDRVRHLLAQEVLAAVHPSAMSSRQLLALRAAWQRLARRTQTVQVERLRASVRPCGEGGRLLASVLVDVYNQTPQEAQVTASFGELPPGWSAGRKEAKLEPLRPNQRGTIELTAEGGFVPVAGDAKLALPLSVCRDGHEPLALVAHVPFVVARQSGSRPKIDGRLDDWPARAGNAAGGFRLLGRRGSIGQGLAGRQTMAFVLHDQGNLYVAFRCQEPDPAGMVVRPSNLIDFQDSLACGEDLVELLLDPGANAAGPEDLYHIVVKSNGVLVARRGVGADAQPWPVAASVAIAVLDDLWTVELAIPLSAFGQAGRSEFWGVNFTRFATQGAEASSWALCHHSFYDVRNLGTMVVAEGNGD